MVYELALIIAVCGVAADVDALERVADAQRMAKAALQSGQGTATVSFYGEDGGLVQEKKVEFAFSGHSYYLDLDYSAVPADLRRYDRVVVVNDGSATFVNSFSPRINPSGCEIEVYEPGITGLMQGTDAFRWQPNLLPTLAMDVEIVRPYKPTASVDADGTIRGSYRLTPKSVAAFTASPDANWNVTEFSIARLDKPDIGSRTTIDWSTKQDTLYVSRIERISKGEGYYIHQIFTVDEITINPAVPESMFTFEALEPCDRARILDRRAKQVVIHRMEPQELGKAIQGQVEDMASGLQRMPVVFRSK